MAVHARRNDRAEQRLFSRDLEKVALPKSKPKKRSQLFYFLYESGYLFPAWTIVIGVCFLFGREVYQAYSGNRVAAEGGTTHPFIALLLLFALPLIMTFFSVMSRHVERFTGE